MDTKNHNTVNAPQDKSGTGSAYKATNHFSNSDSSSVRHNGASPKNSSTAERSQHTYQNGRADTASSYQPRNSRSTAQGAKYSANGTRGSKASKATKGAKSSGLSIARRVEQRAINTLDKEANKDTSPDNSYTSSVAVATGAVKSRAEASSLTSVAKASKGKATKAVSKFKKSASAYKANSAAFKKARTTIKTANGSSRLQKQLAKKSIVRKERKTKNE